VTFDHGVRFIWSWFRGLFSLTGLSALLCSFGALWLCVEITDYFFDGTQWPAWIKSKWQCFLLGGLVAAMARCFPKMSKAFRLNGRDVWISVMIADIFRVKGAIVVGSNTTFDTEISARLISPNSIQGRFTRRFYDDHNTLSVEIDACLQSQKLVATPLTGQRVGKAKEYPIGTCVKVQPKNATGYFVAISRINEHGVASGTFGDLQNALANLWTYVRTCGTKEPLIIPILGSGFSRLAEPREKIIQEIVLSFVAACSESVFTDRLTIVIHPNDVARFGISLDRLADFVRHQCEYAEFANGTTAPIGTPA
jgi:hypothetical protein